MSIVSFFRDGGFAEGGRFDFPMADRRASPAAAGQNCHKLLLINANAAFSTTCGGPDKSSLRAVSLVVL
jgi:hypothetical protein